MACQHASMPPWRHIICGEIYGVVSYLYDVCLSCIKCALALRWSMQTTFFKWYQKLAANVILNLVAFQIPALGSRCFGYWNLGAQWPFLITCSCLFVNISKMTNASSFTLQLELINPGFSV
jgi:hypothetical protein